MARRRTPAKKILSYLAIIIVKLLGVLPLPVARWIGRQLARVAYHVVPRVKSVGLANLDLAYGDDLTPAQKKQILKESLENIALVAVEFPRLPRLHGAFLRQNVELIGEEHFASKRSVIFCGTHSGNWEWMGAVLAGYGYKAAEIVRPLDHPALNTYIDGMRRAGGIYTIPKDKAANEILGLLKGDTKIGILMDQSPRDNGAPTKFFGKPCWTTVAPVMLAIRARAPLFPVAMTRKPDGGYRLDVFPEFKLVRTGKLMEDLLVNTQRLQDELEAIVRKNPGHWLWLHRRWTPRPRLEKEWAGRLDRENDNGQ